MPKSKTQKQEDLATLVDQSKRAKGAVLAYYRGLKVKEVEELRKLCRAEGIDYVVAKKTLLKLAFKDAGIIGADTDALEKPVAIAFSYGDEVAAARVLATFAKQHEALEIAGGVLEKSFVGIAQVKALASLPSRAILLGQVVRTIQAPVSGFVNVLAGNLRGLLYALNAIKDVKGA